MMGEEAFILIDGLELGSQTFPMTTTELTATNTSNSQTVNCYRIYTPGHWEDADGNWINGSWGDWNSVISGYEVEDGEPYGNPDMWYLISDGQPSAELQKSSNLALWYGDFSGKSNIPFATRTWNNTKPAPTT